MRTTGPGMRSLAAVPSDRACGRQAAQQGHVVASSQWSDRLADVAPVPLAIMRADDGVITYANAALGAVLGRDGTELREVTVNDALGNPGAHDALVSCLVDEADGVDVSGVRADGTRMLLEASVRQIPDRPGVVLLALHDVAEERRTKAALTDVARFPDMNPGPVLRMDLNGEILRVNPAARRVFGEVIGANWIERCPGMTIQRWGEVLAAGGDHVLHEAEIGDATLVFTHLLSPTGESVFVFGADITHRRRAEQQLAELARFPDMNPGPVLRMDLEGRVLLANRAARDVFGGEITDGSWPQLYPAAARVWDEILQASVVVHVESRLGNRDYVFAHRMDPQTSLVFVYGNDVTAQRQTERALRQSEKMATLGTLAAGVAHELNNPAAATRRAAEQLRDALARLQEAHLLIEGAAVPDQARPLLGGIEVRAREAAVHPSTLSPMDRSDRESELEDWLDERDVPEPWAISPALVEQGMETGSLDDLAKALEPPLLHAVLRWAAAMYTSHRLAYEIAEGSARISEIVGALKSYSYLGQAPEQTVDVHDGIDNTLVILRHKLKAGIDVVRDYGDIPRVPAYGSELNQVWTNLLDNAADALEGHGTITIRTRRQDDAVVVEVIDDGTGIAPDAMPRLFDPFFTTKAPGAGTGLGLSTSYSIITERHDGQISVESRPGQTRFTVRLPLGSAS